MSMQLLDKVNRSDRNSQFNPLTTLLTKFPDKDWNWSQLSKNPNISINWIVDHPNLSTRPCAWDWIGVCSNPNLSMTTLLKFVMPQLDIVVKQRQEKYGKDNLVEYWWSDLSANLGIDVVDILEHYATLDSLDDDESTQPEESQKSRKSQFKWNWKVISRRADVTLEMMKLRTTAAATMSLAASAVLKANLDYFAASSNPNLTVEVVLAARPELWDWRAILTNPSIPLTEEILSHPFHHCQPIFATLLSMHPLLPFQYVLDHYTSVSGTNANWKGNSTWARLSTNPGIAMDAILTHPELPWDWSKVSSNPNFRAEYLPRLLTILENTKNTAGEWWWRHASKGWWWKYIIDAESFQCHPGLSVHFLIDRDRNHNESNASNIPSASEERTGTSTVGDGHKFCNWKYLGGNPNLTVQNVLDNLDKFDQSDKSGGSSSWNTLISSNKFAYHVGSLAHEQQCKDESAWEPLISPKVGNLPSAVAELTLDYFAFY